MSDLRHGAEYGILNSLRTGNPIIDMMLSCMIPLIITRLIQSSCIRSLEEFWTYFMSLLASVEEFRRSISHQIQGRSDGGLEERNQLLIKALALYMNELNIQYAKAQCSLMAVREKTTFDTNRWQTKYGSTAEQLSSYKTVLKGEYNSWCCIRKDLEFKLLLETEDEGSGENATVNKKVSYNFRSRAKNGDTIIDEFIQEAFNWYTDQIAKSTDDSKYMYIMNRTIVKKNGEEEDCSDDVIPSRRYKLSNRKTFDSLFFPEKDALVKLLDTFEKKEGKYGISGYPHKIGILLHGPPGSGKTSLIKAIASRTRRNVVSVPLAKIETNQQLMDIMFEQKFKISGEDLPIKLCFNDTIFVMEDVDCASRIVHRRVPESKDAESDQTIPSDQSMGSQEDVSSGDILGMLLSGMGGNAKMESGPTTKFLSSSDKLNLQGLLEICDGIIDTEGRILIMTTNHPEKLDPALIRPGRIDKILKLGYINGDSVIEMIKLYFGGKCLDEKRVRELFNKSDSCLTPAQVEQIACEHEDEKSFVTELQSALREFRYNPGSFCI